MNSQGSSQPALLQHQPDSRSTQPGSLHALRAPLPRQTRPLATWKPWPGCWQPLLSLHVLMEPGQMAVGRTGTCLAMIWRRSGLQTCTALPGTRVPVLAAPWQRNFILPAGRRNQTCLPSTFQKLRKQEHPRVILPSQVCVPQMVVVLALRNLLASLVTGNPSHLTPCLWSWPSAASSLHPLLRCSARMEP